MQDRAGQVGEVRGELRDGAVGHILADLVPGAPVGLEMVGLRVDVDRDDVLALRRQGGSCTVGMQSSMWAFSAGMPRSASPCARSMSESGELISITPE